MKRKLPIYDYGECHVCGELMREKRITQEFWHKNTLVLVEDVPAGVCPQCGEKVVKADVGKWIALLLNDRKQLQEARMVSVPILRFSEESREETREV